MIKESYSEQLLGIWVSKLLTWTVQRDALEVELRQRVGRMKRLNKVMPRNLTIRMIEPLFNSKMRYGIELLSCSEPAMEMMKRLHKSCMKAALGIPNRRHCEYEDLLERTGQQSVSEMANKHMHNLSWLCGKKWDKHALPKGIYERITEPRTRDERSRTFRKLEPENTFYTSSLKFMKKFLITFDA